MASLRCIDNFASKLAFFPPSPPSYTLLPDGQSLKPTQPGVPAPPPGARVAAVPTAHGSTIVVAHLPPPAAAARAAAAAAAPKHTLLFAHGNALDLAQALPFCGALGRALRVGVVAFDYSGYGASTGTPSAANAVRDAAAALAWATGELGIGAHTIVLYGQSIGSGPVAALAGARGTPPLAGVVLHSPLASGLRVLKPGWGWWPPWLDIFPVAAAIARAPAPTLVLHGTADDVVPVACGRAVAAAARRGVPPLFVEGAGHDDVEAAAGYLPRLTLFLREEAAAMASHARSPPPLGGGDTDDDHALLLSLAAEAAAALTPAAAAAAVPPAAAGVAATPPRAQPAAAAQHAAAPPPASTAPPPPPYTEPLSGLRLSRPALPRGALSSALAAAAARFARLPLAVAMLRGGERGAPVATVAVVAAADASPRVDRSGAPYLVWTLADLDGAVARVCVRGEAMVGGVRAGTVVAVVGPKLAKEREPPPSSSSASRRRPPALLLAHASRSVLVLGAARDFGRCAARVDGGGDAGDDARCGVAVNAARGPVCPAHAAREAARLRPAQGALADCGLAAHVARAAKRARRAGPAPRLDPHAALAPDAAKAAAVASRGGKDTHGVRFVEATVAAAGRGRGEAGWVKAPAVGRVGGRLETGGEGDDDLVDLDDGDDDDDGGGENEAPEPPPLPRVPPAPPAPHRRYFDPNRVQRSSSAQRAALAALRQQQRGSAAATGGAPPAPSSFAAAFAHIAAPADPASTARPVSRYGAAAGDAAPGGLDAGLDALAAKDAAQQRAATLFKLNVKCVTCAACAYTAEAPHPACVAGRHALTWGTAAKRWFACACGARTATVGARAPAAACRACGGRDYRRVAAGGRKGGASGPVECLAERAGMLARGEEVGRSVRDW